MSLLNGFLIAFPHHVSFCRCDVQSVEQNTSGRRWQLTPLIKKLGRTAAPVKGVMEGAPLTQEGVCQAFQLIHYLNKDSSRWLCFHCLICFIIWYLVSHF